MKRYFDLVVKSKSQYAGVRPLAVDSCDRCISTLRPTIKSFQLSRAFIGEDAAPGDWVHCECAKIGYEIEL